MLEEASFLVGRGNPFAYSPAFTSGRALVGLTNSECFKAANKSAKNSILTAANYEYTSNKSAKNRVIGSRIAFLLQQIMS